MLPSDVIKRVRDIAGDTNVLQFTDSMCLDWINDAVRKVLEKNLELMQKTGAVNTVVGTSTVTLPTDIMKMHSVTFNGSKLQSYTMEQFENDFEQGSVTQSDPQVFYVWGGVLNLYPVPSSVGTLRINYSRQPVDVAVVGSAIDLPSEYHSRLVDYCLAQVAQQDGDNELYQLKMQEFESGVSILKDHPEYDNNLYPFITVSDRDSGYDSYENAWFY